MSLGDWLKFDTFALKDIGGKAIKNPDQMLLGAADPLSAKVWGTVTGRDYKPIVDQFGGPTDDTFRRAEDAGIKTGTAKTGHGIARIIAGAYGGAGAMGALGSAGSATGAAGSGISAGSGSLGFQAPAAANMGYMGGGQGLLAAPQTFMASAPATGAASSGGILSQGNQYLNSANNIMQSASMAQNLANGGGQQQAPSAGLGNSQQRALLGQTGLTANQRRLRGLLG